MIEEAEDEPEAKEQDGNDADDDEASESHS